MPRDRTRLPADADAPLTNARLAAVLAEIADLLDIKGESPFKVGAYRRAADSVARSQADVAAAYRAGRPPQLRGVGESIADRLAELASSGRLAYHDALKDEVPPTLLDLLAIPGVGPRTAGEAWRQLGIATVERLEAAARGGELRRVRGVSAATEARIIAGIGELSRWPSRMRMGEADAVAAHAVALIVALPGVISATATGSVRRMCETVGDLDVLVETERPADVIELLAAMPAAAPGPDTGDRRAGHDRVTLQLRDGPQLDVLTMPPGVAGSYLVHFTGSAEHNVGLRHLARQQGWSLSERGLESLSDAEHRWPPAHAERGRPAAGDGGRSESALHAGANEPGLRTFATEADLYAALGLAEIPPELREGHGEIEAAAAGTLPRLVRLEDLRGDCHSHSDWSDGREPLETMVESARRAGREYQVLSDHSVSLAVANGLDARRVELQRRVISDLNERFAREQARGELPEGAYRGGFRLLHGCELEITVDGRLDYEDRLLAAFDVVVASLHMGRRQPRQQLMARYEVAMRSPHVDIISHPSGRKIGQRPELDLDWEAFYRLAAETGTLLEINGSEARLDLDEHRIRAASQAGCRFVIDSDAHERSEWQNLAWGVAIARRGWLEAGAVANALPRDDFLALMRDKPHRV